MPARTAASYDDPLDRLSNQVGSYDDAQWRMGELTDASVVPIKTWAEREADKDKPTSTNLTPAHRRKIARVAVGPQYGEDALPVADQTRSPEDYQTLRDRVRPIADQQFEELIERKKRKGQLSLGEERAMRERRARRQAE